MRRSRARGFTLVELMVTVAVVAVAAAIGLALLRKGRADPGLFVDQIVRALVQARTQAVAGRVYYRVTINTANRASTITSEYTADKTKVSGAGICSAPGSTGWIPANCAATASGCTIANSKSQVVSPPDALVWAANSTGTAPTVAPTNPTITNFCIIFRPNYLVNVNPDASSGASSINAYIYVGAQAEKAAWRYFITVIGTGVVSSSPW